MSGSKEEVNIHTLLGGKYADDSVGFAGAKFPKSLT